MTVSPLPDETELVEPVELVELAADEAMSLLAVDGRLSDGVSDEEISVSEVTVDETSESLLISLESVPAVSLELNEVPLPLVTAVSVGEQAERKIRARASVKPTKFFIKSPP